MNSELRLASWKLTLDVLALLAMLVILYSGLGVDKLVAISLTVCIAAVTVVHAVPVIRLSQRAKLPPPWPEMSLSEACDVLDEATADARRRAGSVPVRQRTFHNIRNPQYPIWRRTAMAVSLVFMLAAITAALLTPLAVASKFSRMWWVMPLCFLASSLLNLGLYIYDVARSRRHTPSVSETG